MTLRSTTVDETVTATTPVGATALPARPSAAQTVSQSLAMAWRATKKMRRNPEQFFDVTIAQGIAEILPHAADDDLRSKVTPFAEWGLGHAWSPVIGG